MRDKRARTLDRPAFKVLGNRTLLEISQERPDSPEQLGEIKGVTDLILRRFGKDILHAISLGKKRGHGPIPKTESSNPRRRMDRQAERRVTALKKWRAERAKELSLDPGVLCPNSSLEAIAVANPKEGDAIRQLAELKGWFRQEFSEEVLGALSGGEPG